MKIFITYDDEQQAEKPDDYNASIINKRCIKPCYIDINEWLEILLHGGTTRPCAIAGNRDINFVSGQTFFIDIDNAIDKEHSLPKDEQLTPSQALELSRANGFEPFCIYPTFSSRVNGKDDDWYKFRVVYIADKPINDFQKWTYCQEKIFGIYPIEQKDKSTNNSQNLFFGTNKPAIHKNDSARVNVDALLSDFVPTATPKTKPKTKHKKKNRVSFEDSTQEVATAIRNHDAMYIRKMMGCTKKKILANAEDFFYFIYHEISLANLFGVTEGKAFHCLFPDKHKDGDAKPSASVFRTHYGVWQYYCITEKLKLNLKQLVEVLGNFDSEYQALEFIKKAFNLEIAKSEWAEEQIANIDRILDCLARTDETSFSVLCPMASKNIRFAKSLYIQVLVIAKSRIYPNRVTKNGDALFYMTNCQIAKATGKEEKKCQKYLKMLIYHGLLDVVKENDIPNNILSKAVEKAQIYDDKKGRKTNKKRHASFYSIPSLVFQKLEYIESQGRKWKEHGYRMDSICFEVFARTEGIEVASRLYPQTSFYTTKKGEVKQKTTSGYSDKRHSLLTDIVMSAIIDQGFCTEKQAIDTLAEMTGYQMGKKQVLRSITDIMNANRLVKVRANKSLKQQLGITCTGYPNLILADNE